MLRGRVIERELFARANFALREEEQMSACDPAEAIRRARVIDERGLVPAAARVDAPAVAHFADHHLAAARHAAGGFAIGDFLAREFADFAPRTQLHRGETSLAVNARFLDHQFPGRRFRRGTFHCRLFRCWIIPDARDEAVVHFVDRERALRFLTRGGSPDGSFAKRHKRARLHQTFDL